ncbi:MAG: hypothetical protein ABUL63_03055, partial [Acidobacteriota bacterium]
MPLTHPKCSDVSCSQRKIEASHERSRPVTWFPEAFPVGKLASTVFEEKPRPVHTPVKGGREAGEVF